MKITDLIELGRMGYSRKEIDELVKADKLSANNGTGNATPQTANEKLLTDIADLKKTVETMQAMFAKTTPAGAANNPADGNENIDDILLKLAGVQTPDTSAQTPLSNTK